MQYKLINSEGIFHLLKRDEREPFKEYHRFGRQYTQKGICSRLESLEHKDRVDFTEVQGSNLILLIDAYAKRLMDLEPI